MRLAASLRILSILGASALPSSAQAPYLGQGFPGKEPVPFAPGIVNAGLGTRDITFAPDGRAIYFGFFLPGFRKAVIAEVHQEGGRWTAPEVASFARDGRWKNMEPCISPDGQRFFFVSDRPENPKGEKPGPFAIWVMVREGQGWSEPERLPAAVNGSGNVFYPTLARDGTLYFLKEEGQGGWIMRAVQSSGVWQPAEKLPPPFNENPRQANPRIDPEGRFLLLPLFGRSDSLGGADYYGYFRREDGSWTGPVHLGPTVNSEAGDEFAISLSPDGKAVFFGSNRALPRLEGKPLTFANLLAERTLPGNGQTTLWWVDAGFLEDARRKALAKP